MDGNRTRDKGFADPCLTTWPPRLEAVSTLLLTTTMERVTGVEPVSPPWQGGVIAAIRYPLEVAVSAAHTVAKSN